MTAAALTLEDVAELLTGQQRDRLAALRGREVYIPSPATVAGSELADRIGLRAAAAIATRWPGRILRVPI